MVYTSHDTDVRQKKSHCGVSFLANFFKLGMKGAYLCHLDINAVVSVMIFSAECGHDI